MRSKTHPQFRIYTRDIGEEDAETIATIASHTPHFTIPSNYIVWMLASTQGSLCRVAVTANGHVLGYALTIKTVSSGEAFLWQIGVAGGLSSRTLNVFIELLRSLRLEGAKLGVYRFYFTVPGSHMRLLLQKAGASVGASVTPTGKAFSASHDKTFETEYCMVFSFGD